MKPSTHHRLSAIALMMAAAASHAQSGEYTELPRSYTTNSASTQTRGHGDPSISLQTGRASNYGSPNAAYLSWLESLKNGKTIYSDSQSSAVAVDVMVRSAPSSAPAFAPAASAPAPSASPAPAPAAWYDPFASASAPAPAPIPSWVSTPAPDTTIYSYAPSPSPAPSPAASTWVDPSLVALAPAPAPIPAWVSAPASAPASAPTPDLQAAITPAPSPAPSAAPVPPPVGPVCADGTAAPFGNAAMCVGQTDRITQAPAPAPVTYTCVIQPPPLSYSTGGADGDLIYIQVASYSVVQSTPCPVSPPPPAAAPIDYSHIWNIDGSNAEGT